MRDDPVGSKDKEVSATLVTGQVPVSGLSRQHRAHLPPSFPGDGHENHVQAGGSQLQRFQARIAAVFEAVILLSRDAGPQGHVALLQAKLLAAGDRLRTGSSSAVQQSTVLDQLACNFERGRQIWLRFALRPLAFGK